MNYYEHHLGGYSKDTAHLSMIEHGAYRLLIDRYYSTEHGIPDDQAHRVARARTREEKLAVDSVLKEFFDLIDVTWHHKRCDSEIERAQKKKQALLDLQNRDSYRIFRSLVLSRDGKRCAYCGVTGVQLQLDHIFPRSRGGPDLPENLTPACKPCNTSKGAKTVDEWRGS